MRELVNLSDWIYPSVWISEINSFYIYMCMCMSIYLREAKEQTFEESETVVTLID